MPMQQWGAHFENRVSSGAREALEDLVALKGAVVEVSAELQRLEGLSGGLGGGGLLAGATAPFSGGGPIGKSPWEQLAGPGGQAQAKALAGGEKKPDKDAGAEGLQKAGKAAGGLKAGLASAEKAGSLAKTAVLGLAAAAGIAGVAGLFRLAMGWQGMAKLQAITARAQVNVRGLFRGVDPSPALRAADKLSQNLNRNTVTGNALSGVLTRGFNRFFSLLEKGEPYLTAIGQGALIAGLYLENAWLRARIKLFPLMTALGALVSTEDTLQAASIAGGAALLALGGYAAVAAAPLLPLAAAITTVSAALQQLTKLSAEWDENSWGQIKAKLGQDLGLVSQEDAEKAAQMRARGNYERAEAERQKKASAPGDMPAQARVGGEDSGRALGDGLVKGMGDSEAAVKAAGGKLADAANQGVRDKAQIRSPARVFVNDAHMMGAGTVKGLEDKAADVQRAAEQSLVPDVGGAGGARGSVNLGRGSGGGFVIQGVKVDAHFPNVVSGRPQDIIAALREAAPELAHLIFADIASRLGLATS